LNEKFNILETIHVHMYLWHLIGLVMGRGIQKYIFEC